MMDLSFWLVDRNYWFRPQVCHPVSILVMMDLSFWLQNMRFIISFNPCYDGFVILTHLSFNPCYDGFVILTTNKTTDIYTILVMMDLSFWLDYKLRDQSLYSFNPCYDGFVILTNLSPISVKVSILVMMDLSFWLQYTGPSVSILVMMDLSFWQRSFNPCYDGFVILTLHTGEFQSLLWWICHFDCYYHDVLVSILVMMDLSFWHL